MRRRQIQHGERAGAQRFDFGTTGNSAAARPPVMGSLALPRATRFETTTRFTGSSPDSARVLTAIHQYGSWSPFQRNETKFGPRRGGTRPFRREFGIFKMTV
jgi:hypothetical protein